MLPKNKTKINNQSQSIKQATKTKTDNHVVYLCGLT